MAITEKKRQLQPEIMEKRDMITIRSLEREILNTKIIKSHNYTDSKHTHTFTEGHLA